MLMNDIHVCEAVKHMKDIESIKNGDLRFVLEKLVEQIEDLAGEIDELRRAQNG